MQEAGGCKSNMVFLFQQAKITLKRFNGFFLALCNGGCVHGVCVGVGHCRCHVGYFGPSCDRGPIAVNSDTANCELRGDCDVTCECRNGGRCVNGKCLCAAGFHGINCQEQCLPGSWGPDCVYKCRCDQLNYLNITASVRLSFWPSFRRWQDKIPKAKIPKIEIAILIK